MTAAVSFEIPAVPADEGNQVFCLHGAPPHLYYTHHLCISKCCKLEIQVRYPFVYVRVFAAETTGVLPFLTLKGKRRIAPPLPQSFWAAQAAPDVVVQPFVTGVPQVGAVWDAPLLQESH